MAIQRIRQLGDPMLRERSRVVNQFSDAHGVLVDLRDTLREFQRAHGFGRGISAVQVGVPIRAIYLEFAGVTHEVINPEYTEISPETFELWDDCFSFPDLMVRLRRACNVTVRFHDRQGSVRTLRCEGSLSELMQHEMDHLEGVLAVDRAIGKNSLATREEWLRAGSGWNEPRFPAA